MTVPSSPRAADIINWVWVANGIDLAFLTRELLKQLATLQDHFTLLLVSGAVGTSADGGDDEERGD